MADQSLPAWWTEIDEHAPRAGVDPAIIRRIGGAESGLQNIPNASGPGGRPTSSAHGPFQMIRGTFDGLARQYPELGLTDRLDPAQQARAMVYFTRDNITAYRSAAGRDPTPGEIYLNHFLGGAGARRLIGVDDSTPVHRVVSEGAIAANASLFSRNPTVGDLRRWADRHMSGERTPGGTAAPAGREASRPAPFGLAFGDETPSNPVSIREQRAIEIAAANSTPRFGTAAQQAIRQEWSLLWAFQGNGGMAPDPDFRMTPELMRELTQGVPEQYWDYFTQAHSADHAQLLRRRMMDDLAVERSLAGLGWGGVGLRLAAAVLDPAAIGVSIATEGAMAPAIAGMKLGRIGRILSSATSAGASNAIIEAILAGNRPTGDALDVLQAAGIGAVFGSAFGAFSRGHLPAEAARLERVGRSAQARAEADAGRAEGAPEVRLGGDAGAAEASYRESLRADTFDFVRDAPEAADRTAGGRVRFDVSAATKNSENPLTSVLGGNLVEDAVGNADRNVATAIGASERQALISRRHEIRWRQEVDPAYREYAERQGWNWYQRMVRRGEFNEQVTAFVRNTDPSITFDPAVTRAGEAFRAAMDRLRMQAQDPGAEMGATLRPVAGFDGIEANPNYAPRIHDMRRFDEIVSTFGDKNVRALIEEAIRARLPGVEANVARRTAAAYVRKVRALRLGEDSAAARAFSGEDLDGLRTLLREGSMSDDEIEAVVRAMQPREGDTGNTSRAKRRTIMDENFGMWMNSSSTNERRFVRISDLLVNDVEQLFHSYNRSMSGQIALAQTRIRNPNWKPGDTAPEYLVNGITNRGEWDTLIAQVRGVGDEMGQSPEKLATDVKNLEFMYRAIAGIPEPAEASTFGQSLRMLRDYNFIRVMGQVGFAQIPEMMNIMGQVGMRAFLQGIPGFATLRRNAISGRLNSELAHEIEWITGAGTDWLRGTVATRWDDFGNPMTYTGNNAVLNTVDQVMQRGKRVTTALSGMAAVNTFIQRWSAKAVMARFANMAADPSTANMARMRTLGLSDAMLDRVLKQYGQHADFVRGEVSGANLRRLNLEAWTDQEARSAFEHAVFRWSRRIIQENDVGQMARWMSHPLAKTLLQFRSFTLAAWSKNFLHNIHMRDMETFMAFSASMFAAGLTYVAQTHLQAIGRSDREQWLERRLSVDKIALAAFQRAGFTSLSPMFIDMGARGVGADPIFDFRTTGQSSDAIFGNPTVGLIDDASKATAGIAQLLSGEGSQAGMRSVARVLPLQNFLPFTMMFNAMISGLPERERRN